MQRRIIRMIYSVFWILCEFFNPKCEFIFPQCFVFYQVFYFIIYRGLILIIVAAAMLTLAFLGFCKFLIPSIFTYRNGDLATDFDN